jgi:hypothetical protein
MTANTQAGLMGIWGRNEKDLYAVGAGSNILHYSGAGWRER